MSIKTMKTVYVQYSNSLKCGSDGCRLFANSMDVHYHYGRCVDFRGRI